MKTTATSPNSAANFQKRIENQQQRIDQGVASGALTEKEVAKLQPRLDAMKKLVEDGFDPAEKPGFKKVLDGLSKDIHSQKHDRQMDVNKRLEDFTSRIEAGVKDGSPTAKEAERLALRAAKLPIDGVHAKEVNRLDRAIYRQRHDEQGTVAGSPPPPATTIT
ncbi:MAG: hypothetical protein U0228_31350 [Myxococcaceae bacterium]